MQMLSKCSGGKRRQGKLTVAVCVSHINDQLGLMALTFENPHCLHHQAPPIKLGFV